MKFLIAPDSFKGGLKNTEFCFIMKSLLESGGHTVECVPLADGGDGFVDTVTALLGGKILEGKATDANFFRAYCRYGVTENCGIIGVSECCGLAKTMIKNPMFTTSFGVGEIIKLCKALGKKEIVIGLGGSATNDGGTGVVAALGGKFFDKDGNEFVPTGNTLSDIADIDLSEFNKIAKGMSFKIICDVRSPLLGEHGCSRVFAKQKGARDNEIDILENNMKSLVAKTSFLNVSPDDEGMGAAGGLGYGMKAFFNSEIIFGTDYIFSFSDFDRKVKDCDFVITGEGRYDATSDDGKVCSAVLSEAKKYGKNIAVFCGESGKSGDVDVVEINDKNLSLRENISNSGELLLSAAKRYFEEKGIL